MQKLNEKLRLRFKWYYNLRVDPKYRYQNADDLLIAIQRSTKTTFKFLQPLHEWIRLRSRRYYNWHLNPYTSTIHWVILGLYTTAVISGIFFGIFGGPKIPAKAAPNSVGTTTAYEATMSASQRRSFYDSTNSKYWTFYNDGSLVKYSYSSDGATWTNAGHIHSSGSTDLTAIDYSVWQNGSSVYFVWANQFSVQIQKGTLASTDISFSGTETIETLGDGYDWHRNIAVTQDTNDRIWIQYQFSDYSATTRYEKVVRSTNVSDITAWDNPTTLASTSGEHSANTIVPLTSGDMYAIWAIGAGDIQGKKYTSGTSTWDASATTVFSNASYDELLTVSAVSDASNNIHLAYATGYNRTAYYQEYSSGSWGSQILLADYVFNPTITLDVATGNIYAFWIRFDWTDNDVEYKKAVSPYASGDWDTNPTLIYHDSAGGSTLTNIHVQSSYYTGNTHPLVQWTYGEGPSYTEFPWDIYFDNSITAGITTRYWIDNDGGNWNDTANWSATSGGSGGASVPTTGEAAIFDNAGTTHNGNLTLNTNVSIGTLTFDTNYTGTITQSTYTITTATAMSLTGQSLTLGADLTASGTLTIASGKTLDLAGHDLTVTGTFSNSGTLKMTGGETTVTLTAGNDIDSGTVEYYGTSGPYTTKNLIYFDLKINGAATTFNQYGGAITVNGVFNLAAGTYVQPANQDLTVKHDFTIAATGSTFTKGSGTAKLKFLGDLTFTGPATAQNLGAVEIGASPDTTDLAADFAADSLTIGTGDILYTNGYEVDIGTGDISLTGTLDTTDDVETDGTIITDAGNFTINSGGTFTKDITGTRSLLQMDGGATKTLTSDGEDLGDFQTSTASTHIDLQDSLTVDTMTIYVSTVLDNSSGNYTITVFGNWTNAGTFTAGSSTVDFQNTTAKTLNSGGTAAANSFNNLTHSGAGTLQLLTNAVKATGNFLNSAGTFTTTDGTSRNVTVDGNFTISSGTLTANVSTFTISGNLIIGNGTNVATINASSNPTINIAGNFTINLNAIYTKGTTGRITFTGTTAATYTDNTTGIQDIGLVSITKTDGSPYTGNKLTLNTGMTCTTMTISANNTLDISNQTLTLSGVLALTINGTFTTTGSTVKYTATGTFGTGRKITNTTYHNLEIVPAGASTYYLGITTSQTITCTGYFTIGNGTNAITVRASTYSPTINVAGNFTIATGNTYTKGTGLTTFNGTTTYTDSTATPQNIGAVSVNGTSMTLASNMTVDSMAITVGTLSAVSYTISDYGNWSNADTFTAGTGTVTFNGTTTQTITGTHTWYNLTINNTYATPDDTYDVDPASAQTVTNTFTITHGQYSPVTGDSYKNVSIANDAHAILKPDSAAVSTVSGNWSRGTTGVFTANSGTVIFNGTTTQTMNNTNTWYNLTINNTYATPNDSNDVDPSSAQTVTNTLLISDGQYSAYTGDSYKDVSVTANSPSIKGLLAPKVGANIAVSGDWSIAAGGTFTAGIISTVTFDGITTGHTINTGGTGVSKDFYNLTFDGSGGEWSPLTNTVTVTNDLTMTAGTFNTAAGTANVIVNGNVQGTAGIISMTSTNTFTQNVNPAKNFGTTSGSTAWAFYNLTFSSPAGTPTITTQTGGSGSITVGQTLTIGANTTLNAGNRTWILTGAIASPFSYSGTLTPATSTFQYKNVYVSGNVNITTAPYYNLQFTPASAETYVLTNNLTGDNVLTGSLQIDANATLDTVSGSNYGIALSGNWTNSGTFTARSGTVTFNGTTTGHTINPGASNGNFYNLTFNGPGGEWSPLTNKVYVNNDLTMTAGTFNTATGTADVEVAGNVACGVTCGTISMTATNTFTQNVAANKNFGTSVSGTTAWTFNNLTFSYSSGAPTVTTSTTGTGDITINGTLTISGATGFNAGNRVWRLTASGVPFVDWGGFIAGTSTISYESTTGATITAANQGSYTTTTYYNMQTNPPSGTPTFVIESYPTSFLAGTKVLTSEGEKNIEDIKPGEMVKTYDFEKNQPAFSEVTGTTHKTRGEYYIINHKVRATGNHVFILSDKSQRAVETLKVGDELMTDAGTERVESIENIKDQIEVYDLEVARYHLFYAEGYLVHNAGDGYTGPTISNNFTLTGAGSATIDAATNNPDIAVGGNFSIGANQTFSASSTGLFTIAGNWANSGTFTANSGTVTFNKGSSSQTLNSGGMGTGYYFNNLTHSGAGTLQLLTNDLDINGNFSNSTGPFDTNSKDMTVAGSWTNSHTFTAGSRTVTFDGTATGKTITTNNSHFSTLIINGLGGYWTMQDDLYANGEEAGDMDALVISAGTLDLSTFGLQSAYNVKVQGGSLLGGGGSLGTEILDISSGTFRAPATVEVGYGMSYVYSHSGGSVNWTTNSSSFNLDNNGQTIPADTYYNLTIYTEAVSGSTFYLAGSTTINGNLSLPVGPYTGLILDISSSTLSIGGNLTISSGSTLSTTSGPISVGGNWTNSGTFTAGTGTVTFIGTNPATLTGSTTFNNLVMNTTGIGAKTITFPTGVGNKQVIGGTWTLDGAVGNVLTLVSASPATAWYFDIPSGFTAGDNINVTDSWSANAYKITPGANTTNGGNNDGWNFGLTFTVDNNTLDFGNLIPGNVFTGYTETTVTVNYLSGYSLSVSDNISGTNSALLHSDATTRVADYIGTMSTPTSWSGTGLGICAYSFTGKNQGTSKWGSGTTDSDSNNKYAGVPQVAGIPTSNTHLFTNSNLTVASDKARIGYKLVVPNTQKSGPYSGTVTYTATATLP